MFQFLQHTQRPLEGLHTSEPTPRGGHVNAQHHDTRTHAPHQAQGRVSFTLDQMRIRVSLLLITSGTEHAVDQQGVPPQAWRQLPNVSHGFLQPMFSAGHEGSSDGFGLLPPRVKAQGPNNSTKSQQPCELCFRHGITLCRSCRSDEN